MPGHTKKVSIYTHAPIMCALVHTPPLLSKRKRRKKKKKKKKMELGLGDLCIMICVQRVYGLFSYFKHTNCWSSGHGVWLTI